MASKSVLFCQWVHILGQWKWYGDGEERIESLQACQAWQSMRWVSFTVGKQWVGCLENFPTHSVGRLLGFVVHFSCIFSLTFGSNFALVQYCRVGGELGECTVFPLQTTYSENFKVWTMETSLNLGLVKLNASPHFLFHWSRAKWCQDKCWCRTGAVWG